jgi:hypothetical protein
MHRKIKDTMKLFGRKCTPDDRWIFSSVRGTMDTHQVENPVIEVICERHFPVNAGKFHDKEGSTWYEHICGNCGKKIFPLAWITLDDGVG